MVNRKSAAKTLLWLTFSRNQNVIDARTEFADTSIPRIRKSRYFVSQGPHPAMFARSGSITGANEGAY